MASDDASKCLTKVQSQCGETAVWGKNRKITSIYVVATYISSYRYAGWRGTFLEFHLLVVAQSFALPENSAGVRKKLQRWIEFEIIPVQIGISGMMSPRVMIIFTGVFRFVDPMGLVFVCWFFDTKGLTPQTQWKECQRKEVNNYECIVNGVIFHQRDLMIFL